MRLAWFCVVFLGCAGGPGDCVDSDGDGFCVADGDCDDSNPDKAPGLTEVCNARDDDCDGQIDEQTADNDDDGICNEIDVEDCDGIDNNGDGAVDEGFNDCDGDGVADCVDAEDCDGVDNDCDGEVDEGFNDCDNDGIADCVDVEECDGIDNNCDGKIDEGHDGDDDGFTSCGSLGGDDADCDDADPDTHPGAYERYDDKDNDCDLLVDDIWWEVGDLLITEVMFDPEAVDDSVGEWFEVFNASDRDVYLDGLTLRDGWGQEHQITGVGLLVEPDSHVVLGRDDDGLSNGGVRLLYEYADYALSNEIDSVQVWVVDGTSEKLLDAVEWDNGETFPEEPGASILLDSALYDTDKNDLGASWCAAKTRWTGSAGDKGTPGLRNPLCWPPS